MQSCELRLGGDENGDVGVCFFPQGEKSSIGAPCRGKVSGQGGSPCALQQCKSSERAIERDPRVVENLLKLDGCGRSVAQRQVRLTSQVHRIERCQSRWRGLPEFGRS